MAFQQKLDIFSIEWPYSAPLHPTTPISLCSVAGNLAVAAEKLVLWTGHHIHGIIVQNWEPTEKDGVSLNPRVQEKKWFSLEKNPEVSKELGSYTNIWERGKQPLLGWGWCI